MAEVDQLVRALASVLIRPRGSPIPSAESFRTSCPTTRLMRLRRLLDGQPGADDGPDPFAAIIGQTEAATACDGRLAVRAATGPAAY